MDSHCHTILLLAIHTDSDSHQSMSSTDAELETASAFSSDKRSFSLLFDVRVANWWWGRMVVCVLGSLFSTCTWKSTRQELLLPQVPVKKRRGGEGGRSIVCTTVCTIQTHISCTPYNYAYETGFHSKKGDNWKDFYNWKVWPISWLIRNRYGVCML